MALRTLRRITTQEQLDERLSKTLLHMNDGLSSIEEQTHQLTNIVNTFLEVTQLNRGQLALNLEAVNLAEIVQHIVANQSTTSTKHEIRCFIEPCEQPYVMMGDNARLRQILANLLQNAIKYSPLGGPITVSLSQCKESNGRAIIRVSVADRGIGIPKEAQSRLFERFYRAPNTQGSKTRGIGLGLYIVAEILRLHGGTISVESSGMYGEGSRFTFTLPALESDVAEGYRTV
jgi:signal transduction histidine kinase